MLKRIITAILITVLSLSTVSAYGETASTITKYENELYYIGDNIPSDYYILVSKDPTKPAYFGIYSNGLGKGAKFEKRSKLIIGNEADYVYPHYFEKSSFYSYTDDNIPSNQGNLLKSSYFEYSYLLNLKTYQKLTNYNFLYLENCYAISLKDIDKADIDICRDGFIPIKGNLLNGKDYKLTIGNEEKFGMYAFYKYSKASNKPILITGGSHFVYNSAYYSGISASIRDSIEVNIPKDADLMLKLGVNICDMTGKEIYTSKGITLAENFEEKFNFNDVSPTLKTVAKQEFEGLKKEMQASKNKPSNIVKTFVEASLDRKQIFKNLEKFAKNDADLEYVKYVREAYIMYFQETYSDYMISKYLYNASSYKDLSLLLRKIAYDNYRSNYYIFVYDYLYKLF